jgi:hypothetical protein
VGATVLEEVLQFKIHGALVAWMLSSEPIMYMYLCINLSLTCIILFHGALFVGEILIVHKVPPFKYFSLLI